jgi:1,4-alpha-glucan branching enzyme
MAIQEHPYYGSFGYHVSNFFAPSSRFGTPDELKQLIDEAHKLGLFVIMDIVHSHSVKNELEGLSLFDGSSDLYFHNDHRRNHVAWDSLCFDYGKNSTLHFLLSNCKYWLEEFHFDGFRFDGVTSMLYYDHGLGKNFTDYAFYYDGNQDEDAIVYLSLANQLIHGINPEAITIAEEMSGMPGLAFPPEKGGIGFNYRMAMGIPDYWIKIIKEQKDEKWDVGEIFYQCTSKRLEEKVISYAESHDQALVGDKTIIFRLVDKEMYFAMDKNSKNILVDRGMALHKMIRLITLTTAGGGYLNFMGNEFGHPEWIDFPREGNNWSFKHARRLWQLIEDNSLRYHQLGDFDRCLMQLVTKNHLLTHPEVTKAHENKARQILVIKRGKLLFVFNFHPTESYTDYCITIKKGKYRIILNTDNPIYGGFGHIDESIIYRPLCTRDKLNADYYLSLYIPARTAFVMSYETVKQVY